jgi:hypothetical protein
MTVSADSARKYVQDVEIAAPLRERGAGVERGATLTTSLDAARSQATVVGGDVFSFVKGVTAEGREAIINSSLLAQLVAKKKVPDFDDTEAWYRAYFEALGNLGWVIQQREFAEYQEKTTNFETHKAVLALATALLGPAPGALTLVTTTLNALHSMDESRPWITIFNQESRSGRTGRFQISLVNQEAEDQFLVSLLAVTLSARTAITQVLFFTTKADAVRLRHNSSRVTVAAGALQGALPALRQKLAGHISNFVAMVDI